MLEFNTAIEKEILVIELEGSLDSHSAADFRGWFNEKITAGYRAFAVDCLCLEYISSAGISALIDLQNFVAGQNGKLVLFQLSSETRQLLRFLQLDKRLNLVGDYDDAVSALTGIKRIAKEKPVALEKKSDTPVETPEMVNLDDLHIVAAPEKNAATLAPSGEMHVEEHFSADKKGLHPMASDAPPVTDAPKAATLEPTRAEPATAVAEAPAPTPQPSAESLKKPTESNAAPEAKEIHLNAAVKKLITCPNCRNVLRVTQPGDYLCPACRFRFQYKGNA
ncbi:MAG: STAS domain-containing protein [Spirochaetes bacterium]|nr:STAS domain-containing protein [Spirochaetota bacterium]